MLLGNGQDLILMNVKLQMDSTIIFLTELLVDKNHRRQCSLLLYDTIYYLTLMETFQVYLFICLLCQGDVTCVVVTT